MKNNEEKGEILAVDLMQTVHSALIIIGC